MYNGCITGLYYDVFKAPVVIVASNVWSSAPASVWSSGHPPEEGQPPRATAMSRWSVVQNVSLLGFTPRAQVRRLPLPTSQARP